MAGARKRERPDPQPNSTEQPPADRAAPGRAPSCCPPGSPCGVTRRRFLKVAGAGAASFPALAPSIMARPDGETAAAPGDVRHFVPADKNLDPAWVQSLFERGRRRFHRGKALETIGMPVGGIGAGQLYLRGDGTLGVWWIFNRHHHTGPGELCYRRRTPDSPVDQGFAVTVTARGITETRQLSSTGFSDVEFNGEYPIGTVRYRQPGFPVAVEMEAFSPFIPLNAKDSALPATVFHITVENLSDRSLRAGILGWLQNAVCFYSAPDIAALRRSRLLREDHRTILLHSAEPVPAGERPRPRDPILLADFEGTDYGGWTATGEAFGSGPAPGTLPDQNPVKGFLGNGLVNSFRGGDGPHGTLASPPFTIARRYLNFLIGGGRYPGETCINLLVGGEVVRTATGNNDEQLLWHSWRVQEFEGREGRIEIVDRRSGGWGHINIDHVELSDERRGGPAGPLDQLEDFGTMALAMDVRAVPQSKTGRILRAATGLPPELDAVEDVSRPAAAKLIPAFHSPFATLAPGRKRTFVFVLAWHFPNHERGREYAARFTNASEVARYVLDHHARLEGETRRWHDVYYGGTLPYWLLERIHSTASTLATGTCLWWRNGRFWAWEGVGCCAGTCTHVWNYAQAHARLFPELARSVREMQDFGKGFHPETGLVGFRSNDAYAADGQCGTILKAYREHLMSPDDGFLRRNWPSIRKALEFSIEQDANADGVIENTQHNTYDINFEGPNTFVGSLYLAALRAAEEMAREVGDPEFARKVRGIYDRGARISVDRLWNGEYFVQDVDLEKFPRHQYGQGCLSDQLFGQAWAHQLGLGYLYPRDRVRKALQAVWTYNWAPDVTPHNEVHKPWRWFVDPGEAGLFVCTWPRSRHLSDGVLYQNEVWTGIEYQVAAHMIWEGMLTEGLAIVRAVDDRYHPLKRNPYNEVECGDHYARALAGWGVLIALSGFEYHGPGGFLAFAPRVTPENFSCAFTAAEGWGSFRQTREERLQREQIEVRWGRIHLKTLAFVVPAGKHISGVSVYHQTNRIRAATMPRGDRVEVPLWEPLTLHEGESLDITFHF